MLGTGNENNSKECKYGSIDNNRFQNKMIKDHYRHTIRGRYRKGRDYFYTGRNLYHSSASMFKSANSNDNDGIKKGKGIGVG